MKEKVLFICVHNTARSQMAEEYLRKLASDRFEVESAGLEPGTINPLVVEVLKEEGIDITGKKTNSVFEFYKEGRRYHYVITVCSKEASERCPIFPGIGPIQLTAQGEIDAGTGGRATGDQSTGTVSCLGPMVGRSRVHRCPGGGLQRQAKAEPCGRGVSIPRWVF